MKRILLKRFSMAETIGLLAFVVVGVAIYAYAATTVPHTFTAGTTAVANEVNANFRALAGAINAIQLDTPDQVRDKFFTGTSCVGNSANDIMVKVGPLCVDKYEASVWSVFDGTGTQHGTAADDYPGTFPDTGNWTTPLYAVSKAGVLPSASLTWFQAQQACALSGKRLLTNAEWQMAAAGTPDPGTGGNNTSTCNTNTAGPALTGAHACVSNWSVNDMVGNVREWVADWAPLSTACPGWGGFSDDVMCLSGASTTATTPGALFRGGSWSSGTFAGVFTLRADSGPSVSVDIIGFRCTR